MTAGHGRSLLFVNQHYHPDVAATGQHLTDLAEFLSERGWNVEVLCARGRYQKGRLEAPSRETLNGVRVRRYWTPGSGRRTHLGRIGDYLAFLVQAAGRLLFGPRPGAVVVLTTPPLLPALGALVRRLRGVPYAVWSMDLHPEAEVAAGMLNRSSILSRVLFRLADDGYRTADLTVVLGRCMRRLVLAKGVPENRAPLVHVWSCRGEVEPVPRAANPLAAELAIGPDDFVVMYSGNAGIAHRFDPFLQAADRLRDEPGVRFLFVGDGPRRPEIEAFARERSLTNLRYLDYFPRDRLSESLSLADIHLASLRPEFEGIAVPAKLYGAMAAERPVLFLGPATAETGRTVLESGCGAVVDPISESDPAGRVESILREWRGDPEERRAMGHRGREAFIMRYEREPCCVAFLAVLEQWHEGSFSNGVTYDGT